MMKSEFEKLAGYEVSIEDYENIIQPMYMAVNLSKQDFVKVIDGKRFALKSKKQIINEMKKIALSLRETCDRFTDHEAIDKIEKLLDEFKKRFWDDCFFLTRNVGDDYGCPGRGCSYPVAICLSSHNGDRIIDEIELIHI